MANKKRAAIYCRVAQKNDFAMESQEQKLLRFAEQEGFEVAAVFKDNGAVGHGFDREGYKLLREVIKCGEVDTVLVNNLDRISRDYAQLASQLEWFKKRNIAVISANPPESGIVLSSFASLYSAFATM